MGKRHETMTVYKASAGSGKTFTLAVRFIELLVDNPEAYRKTLAVTFTNKATEEMKHRIISQLYGIARRLPDSASYLRRVCDDLGMDEDTVSRQADKALTLILHDFSNFNIETIDAFFQKVLRNLAREMNLNANLRVELNDKEIEEKAVDRLIASLTDDSRIMAWILGYINEKMDDDKSWNVIDSIKAFGKKIFSDDYKQHADEISRIFDETLNPGFFDRYNRELRKIVADANKKMEAYADTFYEALDKAGYKVDDLSYKENGASSFFKKLKDGTYTGDKVFTTRAAEGAAGPGGWVGKKKKPTAPIYQFAETTLVPLINEANAERERVEKDVKTARAILNNINELRLLSHIKETVSLMNAEENRFLLCDTQSMLSQMMVDSDAPFIFEKIGGQLEHIMIDEFQDTSTIQWRNFHTLLNECIAKQGSENLIVGDVKQSIYRWRNGDWDILQSQLRNDRRLVDYGLEEVTLNANYRSEGNIVTFNNLFFTTAAEVEATTLDDAEGSATLTAIYHPDDVTQLLPGSKADRHAGLVDIRLMAEKDDDGTPYDDRVMAAVTEQLDTLFANGVADEDICILSRRNIELTMLAERLQDHYRDHTFVSDEAFQLQASFAVNIIVTAMRVLNHPNDRLAQAQLTKLYQERVLGKTVSEISMRDDADASQLLPKAFTEGREMLLTLPLTDLAEELFRLFSLERLDGETAYVLAFHDQLSTFVQNNNPDLGLLLEVWDESMYKKTVKGGSLAGVRLLTIHKSKGLEADHVLMPYCDWQLDAHGSDLWCATSKEPFDRMPVVPVNSRQIKGSHFDQQYKNEQLQLCIDNLNLLYVAFTRARKNLFIIGMACDPTKSSSTRAALLQRTLPRLAAMDDFAGATLEYNAAEPKQGMRFTFGTLCVGSKSRKTTANVFDMDSTLHETHYRERNEKFEFRQSNASRRFVEPADDGTQPAATTVGTVLHNVLASIRHASEVDKALAAFEQEGRLSATDPELNRDKMARMIRERIERNKLAIVNRWYGDEVEVYNECTLAGIDEETGLVREYRPDRVVRDGDKVTVVDYKFGKEQDSHTAQVRTYMRLLKDMGHDNVEGYLWYVYKNSIKEVRML